MYHLKYIHVHIYMRPTYAYMCVHAEEVLHSNYLESQRCTHSPPQDAFQFILEKIHSCMCVSMKNASESHHYLKTYMYACRSRLLTHSTQNFNIPSCKPSFLPHIYTSMYGKKELGMQSDVCLCIYVHIVVNVCLYLHARYSWRTLYINMQTKLLFSTFFYVPGLCTHIFVDVCVCIYTLCGGYMHMRMQIQNTCYMPTRYTSMTSS